MAMAAAATPRPAARRATVTTTRLAASARIWPPMRVGWRWPLKIPRLKYSGAYSATATMKAAVIQASSKTSRVSHGLAASASARNPMRSATCQRRTEETTGPQSSPRASLSATCRPSVWVAATQSTCTTRKVEFQSRAIGA
jgi:hypothetical protein